MKTKVVWGAAVAWAVGVGAACSAGSTMDWDAGPGDATTDVGTDASAKNDSSFAEDAPSGDDGASGDAGADATSADLECAGDDAGCESCCFARHVDGGNTYFGALVGCACATGAKCHSVANCYGNLCKGGAPSASCDDCLSNPDAGDCYAKAETACAGDPDCVALFDCLGIVCAPPAGDAAAD